jgi:hypothetical protein
MSGLFDRAAKALKGRKQRLDDEEGRATPSSAPASSNEGGMSQADFLYGKKGSRPPPSRKWIEKSK